MKRILVWLCVLALMTTVMLASCTGNGDDPKTTGEAQATDSATVRAPEGETGSTVPGGDNTSENVTNGEGKTDNGTSTPEPTSEDMETEEPTVEEPTAEEVTNPWGDGDSGENDWTKIYHK